jgi:hypothetical protein
VITIEHSARIFHALKREPPLQIVCCWCVPHHIIQVGAEPASHGACPLGVAKFESGAR